MELEMKQAQKIPDGIHTGTIIAVSYDEEPYKYTRVTVKVNGSDIELDYSCPTNLTENSKLMRLLQIFGVQFVPNKKIDVDSVLINQKVQFQTITKPSRKDVMKVYSEIVEGSLRPIK